MHIPDAYIPLGQAAVYWVIAAIFIARSIKWARSDMDENMIPLFGVIAAGMFVLQTINIPIPMSPVSWHMVGAALTAIIFASPWAAVLLMTLVLAVQSLYGDGGMTVMGANIINMGIIGGFSGYYSYIALSKLSVKRPHAMFAGAWISMILPAIALSFELWFAGTFPLKQGVFLMGMFQGAAGIGEGVITVIVFGAISKVRPDIIAEDAHMKVSTAKVAGFSIIAIAGLAMAAPFIASSNPDGLQHTASTVITNELNSVVSPITPLLPGYEIPGMGTSGKMAAIVIGFAAILIAWLGVAKLLKRG
ncbi:cobalt transporter CbiM [Candidatus Methanoperedens nitratireducens]|uniref:Substrate-specific component NikM of nickel ECF transporter (Modular protein) n=1 Tax=Candidatus Methanoperedens nitratireducens TaxID=1392998 RepID=A0A284VMD4_9EURY|nr:cobalt transporter CbiM [Candidatus Methanoperedens nitroreducens]SNQ60441.1 Substrate-specific component NikM of nickel ECF transporter (modular protein) [Candidatus Methanoperedens nitroreducens]